MADYPPYMNAYGNVTKIMNKIKEAKTPDRFSQDFLGTVLGFSGGSATPFIPLAKRIGLVNADGTPSDLYGRFRNPAQSEQAMSQMIRKGYAELYKRNEYAHELDKASLQGLIMEVTGLDTSSPTLKAIANTFEALRTFANFELSAAPSTDTEERPVESNGPAAGTVASPASTTVPAPGALGQLRFSHNVYINLPDTTDVEVFNAIFKSIKEHLLS
jgi:Family of unknown function (DUF5343)